MAKWSFQINKCSNVISLIIARKAEYNSVGRFHTGNQLSGMGNAICQSFNKGNKGKSIKQMWDTKQIVLLIDIIVVRFGYGVIW